MHPIVSKSQLSPNVTRLVVEAARIAEILPLGPSGLRFYDVGRLIEGVDFKAGKILKRAVQVVGFFSHADLSSIIATASPPPMQSAARPRRLPLSFIRWTSVVSIRAPLAPMG